MPKHEYNVDDCTFKHRYLLEFGRLEFVDWLQSIVTKYISVYNSLWYTY